MRGHQAAIIAAGVCAALAASPAWADNSPFVGKWRWNQAQSQMPPDEPVPSEVTAEISRADNMHLKWLLTVVVPDQPEPSVESFDAPANGEYYPVSSDTTAAFRLIGDTLQANFTGPAGETDALSCTVSADRRKMTCQGVLNDNSGHSVTYVDVYDRM